MTAPDPADYPTACDVETAANLVLDCGRELLRPGSDVEKSADATSPEWVQLVLETAWKIRAARLARTSPAAAGLEKLEQQE